MIISFPHYPSSEALGKEILSRLTSRTDGLILIIALSSGTCGRAGTGL